MRINELIVENNNQLDELSFSDVGKGIAKGANVAGKTVGALGRGTVDAVKQFGQGVKQGWQGTKAAMSGDADADAGTAGGVAGSGAPAASGGGAAPSGTTQAAPSGTTQAALAVPSSELDQLKATLGKLNPEQKKELAGELEKSMNAPAAQPAPAQGQQPAQQGGQALDLDQLKQQSAAKQAQGQADQQQATQQMQQTQQSNAAAAQADNALVAAVKAAKAKPGFQQTAQDKLTIQQGAAKGIHESKKKKKKKPVVEFKSKFLGQII